MIDTTFGVLVEYVLLAALSTFILWALGEATAADFQTGEYRDANGEVIASKYLKQLAVWLFIVALMKLVVLALMVLFADQFQSVAQSVLKPFLADANLKLLVVMILTPMVMNAFQFWVVDNFIKKGSAEDSEDYHAFEDGL